MKDFDIARHEREKRDRSFQIGGETFTYRAAVAPESILRWSMMVAGELVQRDDEGKIIRDETGKPLSSLNEETALALYDETILAFLEPGQEEKWAAVRNPDLPHPLSLDDLSDLVQWLFEEQAARPTTPSSGSGNGSETAETGTSSTVASSPQVATA